ncbi:MAG: DUF3395 domain-containing protein [Chloroflexi bacterium]|nr:DUF3395 domain-containing protein [Chloroflexota bacterium]
MTEISPEASFQPVIERIKERLREERETFDQHKAHENRWFLLRLVMGYSSVILLTGIMIVSSYILFNFASFSITVVSLAGAALFADTLGLIISIWKVVFNPDFMTKLAPITQLEEAEAKFLETPTAPSAKSDLAILSAKYGANNGWMDVAPVLRAKIKDGKLQISVTNEELGGDPTPGVVKKLEVTYVYRGQTYSKTIPETEMLSLPEP